LNIFFKCSLSRSRRFSLSAGDSEEFPDEVSAAAEAPIPDSRSALTLASADCGGTLWHDSPRPDSINQQFNPTF